MDVVKWYKCEFWFGTTDDNYVPPSAPVTVGTPWNETLYGGGVPDLSPLKVIGSQLARAVGATYIDGICITPKEPSHS